MIRQKVKFVFVFQSFLHFFVRNCRKKLVKWCFLTLRKIRVNGLPFDIYISSFYWCALDQQVTRKTLSNFSWIDFLFVWPLLVAVLATDQLEASILTIDQSEASILNIGQSEACLWLCWLLTPVSRVIGARSGVITCHTWHRDIVTLTPACHDGDDTINSVTGVK